MAGGDENYAGDVSCVECWEMLAAEANAQLVDVRTRPEWAYVGAPFLISMGEETVQLEWQSCPEMGDDPDFAKKLNEELESRGTEKGDPVLFLCRSGVRSRSTATTLTGLGYRQNYNVPGGFEGNNDDQGHRGNLAEAGRSPACHGCRDECLT